MAGWIVEYFDDGEEEYVAIPGARFEEILDELNGHLEASFCLPNTSANRTVVETDHIIRIRYGVDQQFLGALYDVEYSRKELRCIVYNGIFELLNKRVISGEYLGLMASSVADYIKVAAGITYTVNCPATEVDIVFDQTLCIDAIIQLAELLGKDYWVQYGSSLNIGDRGSAQSFDDSNARVRGRVIGRSKRRNKVHVRGVDTDGEEIMGVAGTGDDVAVFWYDSPSTEAALDDVAAKKLAELNQDDSSVTLTCPIADGVHLNPGDTIEVVKPLLNLNDDYRIMKVLKHRRDMDIEIIRSKKDTEKILEELSKGANTKFSFAAFLAALTGGEGESLPYGVGFGNPIVANLGFSASAEENYVGDVYAGLGIGLSVSFETP